MYVSNSFIRKSTDKCSSKDLTFEEKMTHLKSMVPTQQSDTKVVILGAGPAGLMRAIQSIMNGIPTQIIERRGEHDNGRDNAVAIKGDTIRILKSYGIYQFLIENQLIYSGSDDCVSLRLKDIELAMKKVITTLGEKNIFLYSSRVEKIDTQNSKVSLDIHNSGKLHRITDVDILVNCEGAHSTTNQLLGIERIQVLPKVDYLVGIFDDSPKTWLEIVTVIIIHVVTFFEFLFSSNLRRQLSGSIILNTPGQSYVAAMFSDEVIEKLIQSKNIYYRKVKDCQESSSADFDLNAEIEKSKAESYRIVQTWFDYAICLANFIAFFNKLGLIKTQFKSYTFTRSLRRFEIVNICVDKAVENSKKIKDTLVIISGDACVTADPITGSGLNSAISTSLQFGKFIHEYELIKKEGRGSQSLASTFDMHNLIINNQVADIHELSRKFRGRFRPDKLE